MKPVIYFLNKSITSSFLKLLMLSVICLVGCKKYVQVDPPVTSIAGQNVYTDNATAASVITGLYTYMSAGNFPFATGVNSFSVQCGLSADELTLFSGVTNSSFIAQYRNSLSSSVNPPFWMNLYQFLLTINSAIEGLDNATTLTPSVKQQLLGEAKFMRGFVFFYLANLYGDIPLTLTSDYKITSTLPRTGVDKVYQQVISDLNEAKSLLSPIYLDAAVRNVTIERVRPTKWAASALLARAYLFTGDYVNAEVESSLVINNSQYSLVSNLNNVFLKNSNETIWQLQPVNSGWNTEDARVFVLPAAGPNGSSNPVYLSSLLAGSFEPGDQRLTNWTSTRAVGATTYYFPNKYKSATSGASVTEYLMVIRLAELYLIRSEARAQQNKIAEAQADLNLLRLRAGLPNTTANSKTSLLSATLHERQIELFSEWGHRWLDIKRSATIDAVMTATAPVKGSTWNTNWKLYPIPVNDLQFNPNIFQNPGY